MNTVDSGKLELSGNQKNSSSFREFELLRNGLKTTKIIGLLLYLIRINFDAEKIWRNWRKMAKISKLNPRQI